jgi:hypothetical protein
MKKDGKRSIHKGNKPHTIFKLLIGKPQVMRPNAMLSGSTVTTAWCVLGLWIEETASRYGG